MASVNPSPSTSPSIIVPMPSSAETNLALPSVEYFENGEQDSFLGLRERQVGIDIPFWPFPYVFARSTSRWNSLSSVRRTGVNSAKSELFRDARKKCLGPQN